MTRRSAIAVAMLLVVTRFAATQTPPTLPDVTASSKLLDTLVAEVSALGPGDDIADERARLAHGARAGLRRLAAELLLHGDLAAERGSVAVLHGRRLARGRESIDAALDAWVAWPGELPKTNDPRDFIDIRVADELIRSFVAAREAATDVPRGDDVEAIDQFVADAILPLARATALIEDAPLQTHWLPRQTQTIATVFDEVRAFETRAAAISLDSRTREALDRTIPILERGASFIEHRDVVSRSIVLLNGTLDLIEVLPRCDWLDEPDRVAHADRARAAIEMFARLGTRPEGLEPLIMCDRDGRLLTELERLPASSAQVRSSVLGVERDMLNGEPLVEVVRALADVEAIDLTSVTGTLASVARRLERSRETAREKLVRLLAYVAVPAIDEHTRTLESLATDMHRVAAMPGWCATAQSLAPRSTAAFTARMRRLGAALADPRRHAEAAATIDAFAARLARVHPMPAEFDLRAGEASVQLAVGGQHLALARAIESRRAAWITAWAREDGLEEAEAWMTRLEFLAIAVDHLRARDVPVHAVNRWAAVELDTLALDRLRADVSGRLKLAALAASSGDAETLDRHLAAMAIHRPMLGWLTRTIDAQGVRLLDLDAGATGTLAQSVFPPELRDIDPRERLRLAHASRYFAELDSARLDGNDELVAQLRETLEVLLGVTNPMP